MQKAKRLKAKSFTIPSLHDSEFEEAISMASQYLGEAEIFQIDTICVGDSVQVIIYYLTPN